MESRSGARKSCDAANGKYVVDDVGKIELDGKYERTGGSVSACVFARVCVNVREKRKRRATAEKAKKEKSACKASSDRSPSDFPRLFRRQSPPCGLVGVPQVSRASRVPFASLPSCWSLAWFLFACFVSRRGSRTSSGKQERAVRRSGKVEQIDEENISKAARN